MAKADSVLSTPRRTASKIQTKKRARKADLATAAAHLASIDDAIDAMLKKFGDDADSRKDYLALNKERNKNIAALVTLPASSIAGMQAKAAALRSERMIEDYAQHQQIAVSLADDLVKFAGPDAGKISAIADKFEKLLAKYFDAHLVWARLARMARAVVDAKFPDDDWAGGKTPACRLLVKILRKNGCNAAQARLSVIFKQMTALAKVIEKDKSQSAAALRAKCLVALWEAIPGSADNEGCLTFDDEYPANLLFRATAAFTGLSPSVEVIEAKLAAAA